MSKKRRCRPVAWSTSKNCSRSSGSRQKGFSSLVAMWFGHDVEHDPEPAPAAQSARSSVLAAELLGHAPRVDDVVAVRRAAAGLQHGER